MGSKRQDLSGSREEELHGKTFDVFISHAFEDKEGIATPLARALEVVGLKVWHDQTMLKLGDSLRQGIEYGLANSRYGIVILSASFFAKHWTQQELNGLAQREVNGEKIILPIWCNLSRDKGGRVCSDPGRSGSR